MGVLGRNMKDEIVNYLTVKLVSDKSFKAPYAQRIRRAWVLAEKKYETLTAKEKEKILKRIEEKNLFI